VGEFHSNRRLETTGQAIDSELFTRNSAGLFPGAPVTGAGDVPAPDRSPLKPAPPKLTEMPYAAFLRSWLIWFGAVRADTMQTEAER
jgi:hypothetical protein